MENKNEIVKVDSVSEWLKGDKFKQIVANALPNYITAESFVRIALTAVTRTPKLAECSQASLLKAMIDVGSLGLVPDGRLCHLIPFWSEKNKTMEVQLIIDYKGLVALAKKSDKIMNIRAEVVCEKDTFNWENGIVTHRVNWFEPRGIMKAVYSHVVNSNGYHDFEVMTADQVDRIRERSKAKDSGPWVTDFGEMAKKTVIRRHSKRLDLSPEFNAALEKDDDRFEDLNENTRGFSTPMPTRASELPPPVVLTPDPEQSEIIKKAMEQSPFTTFRTQLLNVGLMGKKDKAGVVHATVIVGDGGYVLKTSDQTIITLLREGRDKGKVAEICFDKDNVINSVEIVSEELALK